MHKRLIHQKVGKLQVRPVALFSPKRNEQRNQTWSSVFGNANVSNLSETLLEGSKDHLLNRGQERISHKVHQQVGSRRRAPSCQLTNPMYGRRVCCWSTQEAFGRLTRLGCFVFVLVQQGGMKSLELCSVGREYGNGADAIVGPHLLHVSLSVMTGECLAQAKGASIHISTCMVAELVLRLQVGVSRLWPCRRPRPRICRSWPRWSRWLCNKREWEALEEEEELDNQEEARTR